MRLWAISDLHVGYAVNRQALLALPNYGDDWLIVAGDVGDTPSQIELGLSVLAAKFRQLIWVPGNHDLWVLPNSDQARRGQALYAELVSRCRRLGVLTPEDPWPVWEGGSTAHQIVPLFLLYDYSFAPDGLTPQAAVAWAHEAGLLCADESFLHPDPYPSRSAWCQARLEHSAARLEAERRGLPRVLVNHFPLRRDLVRLPRIPRFSIWCGTRATEDWHLRFGARIVVSGHLHVRSTDWRDDVRFEEVSLGYPQQWQPDRGLAPYLRQILPEE